jgi:hypothetical protein
VPLRRSARHLPTRLATGAYVLHAGMEKWHANPDQAARMHAMATGAFPVLGKLAPTTFLRLLAAAEITANPSRHRHQQGRLDARHRPQPPR